MNNLPLQPLVWARIDTEKLAGIYCQKTDSYIKDAVSFCSTPVAEYVIRQDRETGKYSANYGGRHENTYSTIDEAEHWAEHTHYASQMQPYVKPMPTWIDASERLPEQNAEVLVRYHAHFDDEEIKEFDVCTAFFYGAIFDVKDQHFYTQRTAKVTHWMSLPNPPEFSTMQNLHKGGDVSDLQRLDHGVLSIPNRTKNINRDLDRYKAEKAKKDKRDREDRVFLAREREAARNPVREQAEALYKQHGKKLRAQLKGKTYGTGCTAGQILKQEIAVNPERFIKMVNKMLSEVQSES